MEVKLGQGLDNLVFGMSQEDVKGILGEPNKVNQEELDFGIVYYYNRLMIKTKFDKDEDLKLYTIEVHNQKVRLFNQNVIGKTKKKIEELLKDNGYNNFEYEEYTFFDTLYVDDIRITFTFKFDRLESFEFSPFFKNENDIIWPDL